MVDTYSSRPFITHDGPDDNGVRAEVKVVTGYGHVDSIEPSAAGKSMKISFAVENSKYKSSGWAPVDSNVHKLVVKAREAGEPIHFRIETRRQDSVDRTTPINDLTDLAVAKDNIHKSLAAVKFADDPDWTISQFAVTNMAEDPKSSFGRHSANDYTVEELKRMSGESNKSATAPSNTRNLEGAPYYAFNPNGDLNPGSIAVSVPLNIYSFLIEYLKDEGLTNEVNDREKIKAVDAILEVCNRAQLSIYEGKLKRVDLSLGSHTRARALVFESVRTFYPLTAAIMKDDDALEVWKDQTEEKVVKMWQWSMKQVGTLMQD